MRFLVTWECLLPATAQGSTGAVQPKHPNLPEQGQSSQPSPGDFGQAGGSPAYPCCSLSTSRQWLLLSQGAISTPPTGKEKEDLSSLSAFLLPCKALRAHRPGPRFMELQREICSLVAETLSLRSLKQNPSPEKTPLSSEEKPDLHKPSGLVSGCTVMQTPDFQKGWKWCIFSFSYSFLYFCL